jgi:glycosyltransferase involved in cell wall biosynthesis
LTLISVVVPVYNGELTIEKTVRSVLSQTFPDFELIVINDGSVDSTLDILTNIQDPRIKVFSYPNAGLSASRNRGIEHACGEFISFIDADDLWTPDKLEAQLNALQEYPEVTVAYSWTDFIDEGGNSLGYGIHRTVNGYVFPNLLTFYFIGSGSNALIRKQVFDEVGGFDESLTSAEDLDMFLRLAARFQFMAVPRPQILYRLTDTSMSKNVLRQEMNSIKVLERAFSQEPGSLFLHLRKSTYANLYIYLASQALRGNTDPERVRVAVKFLWTSIKNDPGILKQYRYVTTLIFKILTSTLLPSRQARALREKVKFIVKQIF